MKQIYKVVYYRLRNEAILELFCLFLKIIYLSLLCELILNMFKQVLALLNARVYRLDFTKLMKPWSLHTCGHLLKQIRYVAKVRCFPSGKFTLWFFYAKPYLYYAQDAIYTWTTNHIFFLATIPDISKDSWSATASSFDRDLESFSPDRAIDGIFQDSNSNMGFFHPGTESPDEWLQINMGDVESVARVELFFRSDSSVSDYANRRTNIEVRVGNVSAAMDYAGNPTCAFLASLPNARRSMLTCSPAPITGSLLVIRQTVAEWWDINEVFAYSFW